MLNDNFSKEEFKAFKALEKIQVPRFSTIVFKTFAVLLVFIFLFLTLTPWQQTSTGFGNTIALDPLNRAQNINATVYGRINKWYVRDGTVVKKGDRIVQIIDNDQNLLSRVKQERDSNKRKYDISIIASNTAKIDYMRQKDLFNKGLSSRKSFEKAKIEYKKLLGAAESVSVELTNAETKLSRQQSQIVLAPRDGIILKIFAESNGAIVKVGDRLATFAPILKDPAVELYVNGNDIPLIYKGRKVRLQFEGWPAIQFSGWPSISTGTFGGIVASVDPSISENGKFRIIVKRDSGEIWPDNRFLRHGAKVYGWVLLNQVKLGYEVWRQINSFPPEFSRTDQKKYMEQE
jgi:multidrug efflux pump subunit AcrA (membrane-fusion protein)